MNTAWGKEAEAERHSEKQMQENEQRGDKNTQS